MTRPEPTRGSLLPTSALDALLEEALVGDRSTVERRLLETLVTMELTEAAGLWQRDAQGGAWRPIRSFGGTTPPPCEASHSTKARAFPLGPSRSVVAIRESFDRDGRREEREETIEALVALSGTLVDAAGGDSDRPPGALRRSA